MVIETLNSNRNVDNRKMLARPIYSPRRDGRKHLENVFKKCLGTPQKKLAIKCRHCDPFRQCKQFQGILMSLMSFIN